MSERSAERAARPVSLLECADAVKRVIPGAELCQGRGGRGVQISWHVRVEHAYDRAPNREVAERLLAELAERVRIAAIRELGLEPILEAQRAEVRQFQQDNKALRQTLDRRNGRIADLEGQLEEARVASEGDQP